MSVLDTDHILDRTSLGGPKSTDIEPEQTFINRSLSVIITQALHQKQQ